MRLKVEPVDMADGQEQKASLAFTFQRKKVVQKVAANVEERKDVGQLISGIEGAKIKVVCGGAPAEVKTYVIPKIENTYKSGVGPKKFTPSYKPPSSDAAVDNSIDRFVQAASTVPVITEYGLQLRQTREENQTENEAVLNAESMTAAAMEARDLREAVQELPDAMEMEVRAFLPYMLWLYHAHAFLPLFLIPNHITALSHHSPTNPASPPFASAPCPIH